MNPLFDKTTVSRLAQAVRRTSPDDWKTSRKRRKQGRSMLAGVKGKLWTLSTFPIAAVFICMPFAIDEPHELPLATACGMMTLNFLILGFLFAPLLLNPTPPPMQPLVNTPADGRMVFLYVLNDFRKQILWKLARGLGYGLCGFLYMHFKVTDTLTWESSLRAVGGGLLIIGVSLVVGYALHMLPRFLNRVRLLLMGISAFILVWQLVRLKTSRIPSFDFLGEAMGGLPQTDICLWILGGPLPMGEMLACASIMLLAIFLITNPLRDRGDAFPDEEEEDPLEIRAESYVAMARKQWRQTLRLREQEVWDEADEDEEEASGEEEQIDPAQGEELTAPLLGHKAAPEEHNQPVEAAFRQAMAGRCRGLLEAKGVDCPLEDYLSPAPAGPAKMPLARKVALYGGAAFPLLLEAWSRLPEPYGKWFIIAAFGVLALTLVFTMETPPHNLHATSSQWVHLPLDPAVHARRFFAYQRRLVGLRCLLVLRVMGMILVSGVLWIFLRSALGLGDEGPVQLSRIYQDNVSVVSLSLLMLMGVVATRYIETMTFFGSFFRCLRWRGLWRKLSLFYALLTLVSAGSLLGALALVFIKVDGGSYWQGILICLLVSEGVYQFNIWMAIQAARWGRGDWMEEGGGGEG